MEIYDQVTKHIVANAVAGWASLGASISALKNTPELRWANPLETKNAVEKAFTDKFGAKETAKPKGKVSLDKCCSSLLLSLTLRNLKKIQRQ